MRFVGKIKEENCHETHGGGAKRQKSLKKGVDNWKREWYTNKAVTSSDTKAKDLEN